MYSVAVIKHSDRKHLRKNGHLAYTSRSWSVTGGSQGMVKQNAGANTACWLALRFTLRFFIQPRNICPGKGAGHNGWALLHQLIR